MKGKIIKYLLQKLAGKDRNGVFLLDGLVITTKIEHINYSITNNVKIVSDEVREEFMDLEQLKNLDVVVNAYETDFIIL